MSMDIATNDYLSSVNNSNNIINSINNLTNSLTNGLSSNLNNSLTNSLTNNITNSTDLANKQNSFLQSNLWKVVNTGIDSGIRALLPDFLEDSVIGIKDALVNNGLQGGIQKAIDIAKNMTATSGIMESAYQSITQIYNSLKNGNLIGELGEAISNSINSASKNNEINADVSTTLTNGAQTIMDNIEANIKEDFNDQLNSLEKLNKYNNNWKEYFEQKDFTGMEKEYKKMQTVLKKIMPTENTLKQARIIENLHNLIKNNNKNFNISEEEIQLAQKLA